MTDGRGATKVRKTSSEWTISLGREGFDCIQEVGYSHNPTVSRCEEYHTHPGCVEFVVCLRGNCVYTTPEGEYALRTGSVMASRPDQPHLLKVYHKGLRICWLHFRLPEPGRPILGLSVRESDWIVRKMKSLPLRIFRSTEALVKAFGSLRESYSGAPHRSAERMVKLRLAALEIIMSILSASSTAPVKLRHRAIDEIAEEMRQHPEGRYRLRDIANRAGMSVSSLVTAFKRQNGLSPHEFLLSCRIALAKRLLAEGRSVLFAANVAGFRSAKRFATYFRQCEGCSPREWPRSLK